MWITFFVRDRSNIESNGPTHFACALGSLSSAEAIRTTVCSVSKAALANGAIGATCPVAAIDKSGTRIHNAISYGFLHDSIVQSMSLPSSTP